MVRAVDIADTLSKTELVRRLYQLKKASSEIEQRDAAAVVRQKTAADAEKTKGPEKSDLVIISTEGEAKEGKKRHGKREGKSDETTPDEPSQNSSEHLDVKA